MQDFPYDIWWLIASYLPVEEVKLLYSVNRSLFNISLDLRYPEVCLSTHPNELVERNDIRSFRNPLLSPRPKTFKLLFCSSIRQRPKPKSFLKNLRRPFVGSNKRPRLSTHLAELIKIVTDVVPRLTGVTTLDIAPMNCGCGSKPPQSHGESDHSDVQQLVIPIWHAFRNQLRLLKIDSALEDLEGLSPGSLQMPALDTLALNAHSTYPNEIGVDGTIAKVLVPILTEHQSTLRNVSFRIDSHDYSPILLCLGNIRRLQSMELFLPPKATPFAGFHVLAAHQASLTSLTLCHLPPPEHRNADPSFFSQDWCSVELPFLVELKVLLPKMSFSPEFADYIHRFASSLVSLTILDTPDFKYEDIREFGSRLRDFHSLRSLTLSIYGFSPNNLALFAAALPHLRSLSLSYHYICPHKDGQHFNPFHLSELYHCEMRMHTRLFSNWELERLEFAPAQNWSIVFGTDGSRKIDQRNRIIISLLNYLPNVRQFCELGREGARQLFYGSLG